MRGEGHTAAITPWRGIIVDDLRYSLGFTKLVVLPFGLGATLMHLRTLAIAVVLFTSAAVRASDDEPVRPQTVGVATGLRSYTPDRWGLFKAEVVNRGDEESVLGAEVFLEDDSSLRFGRDIWAPPQSRRSTWIPLYFARDPDNQRAQANIGGRAGGKTYSNPVRIIRERFPMAILMDRPGLPHDLEEDDSDAYEVVLALRSSLGLSREVLSPSGRYLPPTVEGWDAIGHVVLAGDCLSGDAAGQAALRQWIAAGGRLWIQLNSTPPETIQSLLGDAFRAEIVDRVALSTLPDEFAASTPLSAHRELEQEVELVRVLVGDAEVLSHVNSWPASFAIPFGRGEVLVTTLGPGGWMRLRNNSDPEVDAQHWTRFVATEPLRDFQFRFLNAPYAELPSPEIQRDYLAQKIGYEVPSRAAVLGLLVGFCGLIGLAGLILARGHRLEHLSWLTVAAGLVSAGAIIGLGAASQRAVPPTAAEVQFAEVVPQADTIATSGSLAIYQSDLNDVQLQSMGGPRLDPKLADLAGQVRQINWTDLNQWRFERMDLPPGVRMFDAQGWISSGDVPRAVARFGPRGLDGTLTAGVFQSVEDAMIAPAYGTPLAANMSAEGAFHAGPGDQLAAGQFSADKLLNDEQLRRQKLASAWFAGRLPNSPLRLVAWAKPVAESMKWSAGTRQVGALLLSVPVTVERTPPDSQVAVADAFMELRSVAGTSGRSTHFDNRDRTWQSPQTAATATRLRWQLPTAVLPLQVERAKFALVGNIPSRQLTVHIVRGEEQNLVVDRSSPSGQIEIELTDAAWLQPDSEGGLTLEIAVGEPTGQIETGAVANATWSIRSTTLDIWGNTLPENAGESR